MKADIIVKLSFAAVGLIFAVLGIFVFRPVLALVDATSSLSEISTSFPSEVSTSTDIIATSSADAITSDSTTPAATPPESTSTPWSESSAQTLIEVHIIGKKYVDYFTDGTTLTSLPGNSNMDANLDQPNAPIPTHEGLTWDHTATEFLYDTPSGDLDPGDYAQMPSGNYIAHYPATVYTDATSTVPQPDRITTAPSIPTWDHLTPSSNSNDTTPMPQPSQEEANSTNNATPQPSTDESSSTTSEEVSSPASSTSPTDNSATTDTVASSTSL
jgi:hypothetical protein